MKVYLTCPVRGHLVQIEFSHGRDGRLDGVNSCSVFCPETAIECEQLCVERLNEKIDREVAAQTRSSTRAPKNVR